jgi:hypothetical protein
MEAELESQIIELTRSSPTVAVAECIDGIGCSVYAKGRELPPWASHKVQELVGSPVKNGVLLTSAIEPTYFILSKDDTDQFDLVLGPLSATELVIRLVKTRSVGK